MRIRNWEQYQHYGKRNPPWIKLHYELLQSRDWVMWDNDARVLAIACMLVASRGGGYLPDDLEYLSKVMHIKKPNFKPLIDSGFLASTMLADASGSVSVSSLLPSSQITQKEVRGGPVAIGTWLASSPEVPPEDRPYLDEMVDWAKGKDARKHDWPATLRNWRRREQKRKGGMNGHARKTTADVGRELIDDLRRANAARGGH